MSKNILEFTLIAIHSLELTEIIVLSLVSKPLLKAMKSLTEICCSRELTEMKLKGLIAVFREIKLLSINALSFTSIMMDQILHNSQISLLQLHGLNLSTSKSDIEKGRIASQLKINSIARDYTTTSTTVATSTTINTTTSAATTMATSTTNNTNVGITTGTVVVTDTTHAISYEWPHIRSMALYKCHSTSASLEIYLCNCENLLHLTLHGNIYVKTDNIQRILSKMQCLETLDLCQLLGVQRLVLSTSVQKSLRVLKISKCSYILDILINMNDYSKNNDNRNNSNSSSSIDYDDYSDQFFQSLTTCDLSNTSVTSECITKIVSTSPYLKNIILQETLSVVGSLHIQSKSLQHIDLQQSCNIRQLQVNCLNLTHLDLRGCYKLKKLNIKSHLLQKVDLTMLTCLKYLEINCHAIRDIEFSGCRNLYKAKVSSQSIFSATFQRNYFHNMYVKEHNTAFHDRDFFYFGISNIALNKTNTDKSSDSINTNQPVNSNLNRIRNSQVFRRTASI